MKGFNNTQLKDLYIELNERYFDNQLPTDIKVEWSNRMTASAGLCYHKRTPKGNEPIRVALSVPYHKRFINEIVDTLAHEMVHVLHPNDGHGSKFKAECNRINNNFGLNLTQYATDRATPKQYKYLYSCQECDKTYKRVKRLDLKRYTCNCKGKLKESVI